MGQGELSWPWQNGVACWNKGSGQSQRGQGLGTEEKRRLLACLLTQELRLSLRDRGSRDPNGLRRLGKAWRSEGGARANGRPGPVGALFHLSQSHGAPGGSLRLVPPPAGLQSEYGLQKGI